MSKSQARRATRTAAAALAIAATVLAGCGGSENTGTPGRGQPTGGRFNVVLISLDTTRADRLGCYGHPEAATPNVDALAASGVLFEQAVSPAPTTLPAHSSLMTGTDPFVHGVRYNGSFQLADASLTLAEVLREEGYATGAAVGAYVLNHEFGLAQGFDEYHDLRQGQVERTGDRVTEDALTWLHAVADGERPFFLWVHYFDPHAPYEPPPEFAGRYSSPYLGELAYADEQVGRLLAEIGALGLRERTLVVLVGDHGESLGDHGEDTHSIFVYDSTTAVPMLFSAPGRIPARRRVETQTRLIDVAPTIAAFVGAAELPSAQGVSLLPLMADEPLAMRLPAYSETLFPQIAFGYSPLRSLRDEGWKYIHAPTPELYDLEADPGETRDLADAEEERVRRMREQLRHWIEEAPVVVDLDESQQEMTDEQRARLQSLGYLGGSSAGLGSSSELARFDPSGPDPKDRLEVMTLSERALTAKREGDLVEAERLLRRVLEIAPTEDSQLRAVHELLASILVATGRFAEAIPHYEATLASGEAAGETPTNLGGALIKARRIDEAIEVLQQALQGRPVFADTHVNYGVALMSRKRYDEAIEQFRQALEMDPSLSEAHANLAFALASMGRADDAIAEYEKAIALDPDSAIARRRLAELYIERRDPAAALEQYRELLRLTPDDARVHQGLGMIYLQSRRAQDAERSLRRSVELDPGSPHAWYALSGAQAALGRLDEAVESATRAASLADKRGDGALASRIRERIAEYRRARN